MKPETVVNSQQAKGSLGRTFSAQNLLVMCRADFKEAS